MPQNFHFLYFAIWTSAVICLNYAVPVKVKEETVLDKFVVYFVKRECKVLDSVVKRPPGMDGTQNLNFLVPLEACAISNMSDPVMPVCNEAFELIANLSTCRVDIETLNKELPLIQPINVEFKSDDVCEGLLASQSLFLRDPEFIAHKLGDKMLCPFICSGKTLKACSFLLWGYRVQAAIYDQLKGAAASVVLLQKSGGPTTAVAKKDIQKSMDTGTISKITIPEEKSPDNPPASHDEELQQAGKNHPIDLKSHDESAKVKSSPNSQNITVNKQEPMQKVKSPNSKSVTAPIASTVSVAEKSTTAGGNLSVSSGNKPDVLKIQKGKLTTYAKGKSDVIVNEKPHESTVAVTHIHAEEPQSDENSKDSKPAVSIASSDTLEKVASKINEATSQSFGAFAVGGSADTLSAGKDVIPATGNQESTPERKIPEDKNVNEKENMIPDDDDNDDEYESPTSKNSEQTAKDDSSDVLHPEKNPKETPSSVALIDTDSLKSETSQQTDNADGGGNIADGSLDENGDPNPDFDDNSPLSQPEGGEVENDPRGSESVVNSAPDRASKRENIVPAAFPEQEDTHFFFYFVTIVIFAIGGYVLFHNKQKIFALIIEGRHERRRRSGASYRKLETK